MQSLSYPIGKYVEQPYSEGQRKEWLLCIQTLPDELEQAISNLDASQFDTPYRDGGWTVQQLVHHIADSHMQAYIRFKLGLTEDKPHIKPYDQNAWALLPDSANLPVNISITLLHSLHIRWIEVLMNMQETDFQREVYHPEHKTHMTLWYLLGMYAWHGKHHVAHITALRIRNNWSNIFNYNYAGK
ncbi:MAG: YfiT family bacillithiol transferase [Ferruginibacter sp.]